MNIGLLAPSIYMSPMRFGDMIFAPRELAVLLADGLVDRGHDVFFFTAADIPTKASVVAGDMQLMEDLPEEKHARVGGERQKWASFYLRKRNYELDLTRRAYSMARQGKLDIIHSYHDGAAHFFDELTGFPTVYTLHDPLPKTGTLSYWLLEKFSHHRYVSISNSQRRSTLPLNFVATVHHGVDTGEFSFSDRDHGYLLFIGRLTREKGLHTAIQTALTVGETLAIGTDFPMQWQGDGYFEKEIKPYLDNPLIREPGMVRGIGKVELYQGAKALLFPIEWEEPFGMVMIEAMACGTLVIAYNRGSVPEIVRDGITGFIIDPDDENRPEKGSWIIKQQGVAGLVEAIKRIGEIDRAACRRHVEEHFTVEKMVEGYEHVYNKLIHL